MHLDLLTLLNILCWWRAYLVQGIYVDDTPIPFPSPKYPSSNRTAVIISGHLRSGNVSFLSGKIHEQRWAKYFGEDDPPTPIRSQLDHLLRPFALYGGIDLFIYIPVSRDSSHTVWDGDPVSYEARINDSRPCELYADHPIFAPHTKNKVFCMLEYEDRLSDPFIEGLAYWRRYYFRSKHAKEMFLQQEYGKYRANFGAKQYALMNGFDYRYKIRLRPDIALVKPFPSIESMRFSNVSKDCPDKTIYFPSAHIFGVSGEDSFNIGETEDMEHVLDRYLDLFTKKYEFGVIPSIPRSTWNSEAHLLGMLTKTYHTCLLSHPDIWMAKMRLSNYVRTFSEIPRMNGYWRSYPT
jgi:hypothetical protein